MGLAAYLISPTVYFELGGQLVLSRDSEKKGVRSGLVQKRPINARWLFITAVLGLLAKLVRPAIVSSGVNDLGLAGVLPNLFWAAFLTFLFAMWMSPRNALGTSVAANVLYELDQLRPGGFEDTVISSLGRTFDPWDIVATVVGATISYVIVRREISASKEARAD